MRNHFDIPNQSEASHRTEETCNIVVFGETGAGKSSLINLVTKEHTALTSCDTMGCTTQTNVYDLSIESTQSSLLKVKLFDTPGECKFAALGDCCGTRYRS
jgi:small GTP-binding protein